MTSGQETEWVYFYNSGTRKQQISFVTQGTKSVAGIFTGVTWRERADFTTMSAFSLPEIPT